MAPKSSKNEAEQLITIPFSLTESVAGTYTQVSITMPVEPASGLVFDLEDVEYYLDYPTMAANSIGQGRVQFTHSTHTGILGRNDADIISFINRDAVNNSANAAFYTYYNDYGLGLSTRNGANYIVDREIFLGIQMVNMSAAKNIQGNLVGKLKRISQADVQTLLLDQLA